MSKIASRCLVCMVISIYPVFAGCSSCSSQMTSETRSVSVPETQGIAESKCAGDEGVCTVNAQVEEVQDTDSIELPKERTPSDHIITRQGDRFRTEIHFPSFGHKKVDMAIERYAEQYVSDAEIRLSNAVKEADENVADINSELGYEVLGIDGNYVSILFHGSEYTGGAHNQERLDTVMLDNNGNRIDPWSLFDDVDAVLPQISQVARDQLHKKMTDYEPGLLDSMIKTGTEPKRENFRHIIRTNQGMRIYFEPYSILPGSEGVQFIDFPLELK